MDYTKTILGELDKIATASIKALPSIVIALLVLTITLLLARSAARLSTRLTRKATFRDDLKQLIETLVRLSIWIVGLLVAATIVFPSLTPASLIGGLGIGALAIGFAFQDIFENFLAGVLIMLRDKMQMGDLVETEGVLGKVEHITLRETHLRQPSGELTIMPNSMIFKNSVKILNDAERRRDETMIGVSYDSDLRQAESVIRSAVEAVGSIAHERGVDVYTREFGASSVDFLVRWWVDFRDQDMFAVRQDVMIAIYDALNGAQIEIPFPYVTHTFKEDVPVRQLANSNA